MSKIYKKYISNVSTFFPIKGKAERKYLRDLKVNVYDYCMEQDVVSMDTLYEEFGTPFEVANSFFSNADTNYIIKRIRISKFIKSFLVGILLIALVTAITFCTYLKTVERVIEEQKGVLFETVIE